MLVFRCSRLLCFRVGSRVWCVMLDLWCWVMWFGCGMKNRISSRLISVILVVNQNSLCRLNRWVSIGLSIMVMVKEMLMFMLIIVIVLVWCCLWVRLESSVIIVVEIVLVFCRMWLVIIFQMELVLVVRVVLVVKISSLMMIIGCWLMWLEMVLKGICRIVWVRLQVLMVRLISVGVVLVRFWLQVVSIGRIMNMLSMWKVNISDSLMVVCVLVLFICLVCELCIIFLWKKLLQGKVLCFC